MTDDLHWRISSFTTTNGSCFAVATIPNGVLVRNSNHPSRGTLVLPRRAVAAFVAACSAGEYDDLG